MERVTGIGGAFFRARDPDALSRWYWEHLGINPMSSERGRFGWASDPEGNRFELWEPAPESLKRP